MRALEHLELRNFSMETIFLKAETPSIFASILCTQTVAHTCNPQKHSKQSQIDRSTRLTRLQLARRIIVNIPSNYGSNIFKLIYGKLMVLIINEGYILRWHIHVYLFGYTYLLKKV